MATFQDYPFSPATAIPDGLHSRADWEIPSPTAVQSCMTRPSSPPPYSPASYGYYYDSHDVGNCMQGQILCEQRYATLQARVDDLNGQVVDLNGYCKRSQCSWCRIKSSFKRALSLKSRKKAQHAPEKEQGQEQETNWHSESRPCSPVDKPPVSFKPAELLGREFIPVELPAVLSAELSAESSVPAQHPHVPAAHLPQPEVYPYQPSPYGQYGAYSEAAYGASGATNAVRQPMPGYSQAQSHRVHDLPVRLSLDTAAPYQDVPSRPFSGVSFMSAYTAFMPDGHPTVSPQSSISSVSSSVSAVSTSSDQSRLLFTEQTTSSPVEYAPVSTGDADWYTHGGAGHQNSWDSVNTAVELPDTSLLPELAGSQWQQEPAAQDTSMPLLTSPLPLVFPNFGAVPPVAPLAASGNATFDFDPNLWQTSHSVANAETDANIVAWPPLQSPFPVQTARRRRPRQNSWDSTTSTVLNVLVSENCNTPDTLVDHSPASSAVAELPSQQKHRHQQQQRRNNDGRPPSSHPKRPRLSSSSSTTFSSYPTAHPRHAAAQPHQNQQQERVGCADCDFFPDPGPDQRKKLARHRLTNKHRRNTGSSDDSLEAVIAIGAGGENLGPTASPSLSFPCPVVGCESVFNRGDNLVQHVRKKHGGSLTRGERRLDFGGAVAEGLSQQMQMARGAGIVGLAV